MLPLHQLSIDSLSRQESHIFKLQFEAWDDMLAVDYTRTTESIEKRGSDIKVTNSLGIVVFGFKLKIK